MKKDNFSVINYTDSEIPIFRETQGQKYVTYGIDDLYGEYLQDLFLASSTNGAIINGVADMIYGGGLDATDKDDSDEKKEQWIRLQDLLRKSDDDLLQRVAFDIKLYGMAYLNVIWNAARTRIGCIKHLPVHTMRCGVADSEGAINDYFYKSDWRDRREKEKVIKAFSNEDRTTASTCLQIKRYTPSLHYYSVPDSVGGTNYCELDREISEFHLQGIRRGFFPSMLLSFKNGVPSQEERRVIEQKVVEKFTGADNAGRILITFNDGDETAPEFTPIAQNGADGMYEYLSKLVSEKILTSHRVVSPLMFGIRTEGTGFGNNADELRDSYSLFNNTVIAPFQNILLNTFGMLFGINDIELDIFFITAKPADFLDLDVIDTLDEGEQQKEGVTSEDLSQCFSKLPKKHQLKVANYLIELGEEEEDILKGYDLIDSRKVDYDAETELDSMWTFASVPSSKPQAKSDHPEYGQDTDLIKVRYKYKQGNFSNIGRSREFCDKMMSANRTYRKEDIIFAGDRSVNPGWGPYGASTYSIWEFKGGALCRHWWERRTFLKKNNKRVTVNEARDIIRANDGERLQRNDIRVAQAPRTWPDKGFVNPKLIKEYT
jgi:hypothetical protein